MEISPIAYFHSPFSSKFGIPKQSGLIAELKGHIVFTPEYRDGEALRGLDGFSYIWLLWEFSANSHEQKSKVVRPPLLGGNKKVGVFASRSPFRPNNIGLSSVRMEKIEWNTPVGPIIHVLGADLMDGTPIFDIKPYVTFADSHPDAESGFVSNHAMHRLQVTVPEEVTNIFSDEQMTVLRKSLELDPRPHYQNDAQKIYGMTFLGYDIHFNVDGEQLTVIDAVKL
jgi:tRNA-Thr(GGU) m(6)t(6)A37 methyltransferase TsaA